MSEPLEDQIMREAANIARTTKDGIKGKDVFVSPVSLVLISRRLGAKKLTIDGGPDWLWLSTPAGQVRVVADPDCPGDYFKFSDAWRLPVKEHASTPNYGATLAELTGEGVRDRLVKAALNACHSACRNGDAQGALGFLDVYERARGLPTGEGNPP